jgi:hypothetical protein
MITADCAADQPTPLGVKKQGGPGREVVMCGASEEGGDSHRAERVVKIKPDRG